jgi:Tfp pilus assembly PilM family ATPase
LQNSFGQSARAPLPKAVESQHIVHQQEMISDSLRSLRDQGQFAASDAGIIIPSHLVTIRQVNLPYISSSELAKDGQDSDFWAELEPEISKLEDLFIAYYHLVSSENDDLTRVVIGYCGMANLRPWSDILLGAHLNPTYIDLEPLAMVNYPYACLPRDERR